MEGGLARLGRLRKNENIYRMRNTEREREIYKDKDRKGQRDKKIERGAE